MKYPKIHTIFKRKHFYVPKEEKVHLKDKNQLIWGDYSCEEFSLISKWYVEEKVDGTNIRIIYNPSKSVEFRGRNDDSMIPAGLLTYLNTNFTQDRLAGVFGDKPAILFGEGVGPGIQTFKRFNDKFEFIMFDLFLDGAWKSDYLKLDTAAKLNLRQPHVFGMMNENEIFDLVKENRCSTMAMDKTLPIEGVVCRTSPLLLFGHGSPLMFKLKWRDVNGLSKIDSGREHQRAA